MTAATDHGVPGRPWRRPMRGRDPGEEHRASTPLELLFDLTFVVAVSQVSGELAHAVEGHRVGTGLVSYLMVFFAIWWAWMNFTWFASAYDSDDVPYRLLTLVQMGGVLVLAAAVPQLFEQQDFRFGVVGYVIMRVAMVAQWLRAAHGDDEHRSAAGRYAVGVCLVQVGWLVRLALPASVQVACFLALVVGELAVPVWAERPSTTPWHAEHIAERYGLFVIIVLGECVLGASAAVERTLADAEGVPGALVATGGAALVLVFALWWLYFLRPFPDRLPSQSSARTYLWGYVHYGVFAALAALGSGLEVAAVAAGGHDGGRTAAWAVALPVAAFLMLLTALGAVLGMTQRPDVVAKVLGAAAVLAVPLVAPSVGWAVTGVAVPVVALVARGVVQDHRVAARST